MTGTVLRPAQDTDAAAVAEIWREGWVDGHSGHVPDELVAFRTEDSFRTRAVERVGDTTVAETDGAVAGFIMVLADEVEQVYVRRTARGSGVAGDLLAEGVRQVGAAGYDRAWLAVATGNSRARRFYEREGWQDEGAFDHPVEGPDGTIDVPCHRCTMATSR
ncbi:GNAT family N-acetyltransferase [Luteipulveratus mongoliensis]|uniref:GCN5 family acetyltransferase n=1 Tax=Luteipulveratus mongoliensis TaxID=571913 RepID=A0A0K1JGL3_9MICO|nr:GNAT family N-acetyltransferase [Luteipulveratus mongoliensis]AKU15862.1 GCN5 family acetyltransferase [Luteipulveratus mongoliensis]